MTLFLSYFEKHTDDPLIKHMVKRRIRNYSLGLRRHIEIMVDRADPPKMEWKLYILAIMKFFPTLHEPILKVMGEKVEDQWKLREDEITKKFKKLLTDLNLPIPRILSNQADPTGV